MVTTGEVPLPPVVAGIVIATVNACRVAIPKLVAKFTKKKTLEGVPVNTFSGPIKRRVLKNDTSAFRFSGGSSGPKGRFLTTHVKQYGK